MRKLFKQSSGAAVIEFALYAPILIVLLFAGFEVARYINAVQRVDKAAYVIADAVAQYAPATKDAKDGEITVARITQDILPLLERLLGNAGGVADQAVVITSVQRKDGQFGLRWQRAKVGGNVSSIISVATNSAPINSSAAQFCKVVNFSAPYAAAAAGTPNKENMIVGEVFLRYRPLIANILGVNLTAERVLSRAIFIHPRAGDLLALPPAIPTFLPGC